VRKIVQIIPSGAKQQPWRDVLGEALIGDLQPVLEFTSEKCQVCRISVYLSMLQSKPM